ncbi:ATP-binding protein [Desulfomonile tiedjei]|uniref:Putative ATPase n=1 Tax=Desulfomonile tiedjei (strain ATCC 49306 / DSM 6799 / DCB-1) TaxID=706587 RepID=I4C187_DESTA|nr:ATP-binding protein [Desulfomonile tiedjei]AFM23328.1 putative ATPase [Desulfomonile tiedjei DSM 6799]
MTREWPTLIGYVESVKGGVVTIRLRDNMPTFIMIDGHSYRIGQVGAFLRIPLGYNQLYLVCTLVGAAAAPRTEEPNSSPGHRWLSATLFGESIGGVFDRGVSQYPTIEDEVHLVSPQDMRVIYGSTNEDGVITVGHIAAASGISGDLNLGGMVTKHSAVVGSTGSGKSNFIAVLLEAIATQGFPAARLLVIDPHGEYASAVGQYGRVFKIRPDTGEGELPLYVPFWALPFDELQAIALGQMQPSSETAVRDDITALKKAAAAHLKNTPLDAAITADSPIPFSLKRLWFELDDFERQTFQDKEKTKPSQKISEGNAEDLLPNQYPAPNPGNQAPFAHPRPRNIGKQLELLRSRLQDSRYSFLFQLGEGLAPNLKGEIGNDLHHLVQSWVGHEKPLTVLDVSGLPPDVLSTIVGTLIRIVYDLLYWALDLPISGRNQPLLIVLEEAHLFLPEGGDSAAHRTISRIAKEGRKYGVGLCVVTQRPGEIDSTILSQCGTMIALRLTNSADRSKVESAMPDDLGALSGMLPALRTGEGIVLGEAMPIPSRIQFFKARHRPLGDDPNVPWAWRQDRPDGSQYESALNNWRNQTDMTDKEKTNA